MTTSAALPRAHRISIKDTPQHLKDSLYSAAFSQARRNPQPLTKLHVPRSLNQHAGLTGSAARLQWRRVKLEGEMTNPDALARAKC